VAVVSRALSQTDLVPPRRGIKTKSIQLTTSTVSSICFLVLVNPLWILQRFDAAGPELELPLVWLLQHLSLFSTAKLSAYGQPWRQYSLLRHFTSWHIRLRPGCSSACSGHAAR
jgi:hypothetical protein